MKLLLDTNVLIPLEPTRTADVEPLTGAAAEMVRLSVEFRHQLYVHPAADADIDRDRNLPRRNLRRVLLGKYTRLPEPPDASSQLEQVIGTAPRGSNDWVDHQLLAAIEADAVDFLVTEDQGLHGRARRAGLGDRVLAISEAVTLLQGLSEKVPPAPPAVRPVKVHSIDPADRIFDSLRTDYPGFDDWLRKCRREHRQAWIIEGGASQLAALCIINPEKEPPQSTEGKVLKICTLKVSEDFGGVRYGELLLKTVFAHASENQYDWIFIEVFGKHCRLVGLLEDLGFQVAEETTAKGEMVLTKPTRPEVEHGQIADAMAYHIRYGPRFFVPEVSWYVVPIQPRYTRLLFPETERQPSLFPGSWPFGNAIRKAYLCHSSVRNIQPADVLVFYRSESAQGAVAVGVVERTVASSSVEEIVRAVGKRTVYTLEQIETLCEREVLAILFRQSRILTPTISADDLVQHGIFRRPPQSIMSPSEEGLTWLRAKLAE